MVTVAAMDLGKIGFTIEADTSKFDRQLQQATAQAKAFGQALDKNGAAKLDVDTSRAERGLGEATAQAEAFGKAADRASGKRIDVTPTGGAQLDNAAHSAETLGKAADDAAASAQNIRVPGELVSSLSSSSGAAGQLADELDRAGREASEIGGQTGGVGAMSGALGKVVETAKGLAPALGAAGAASAVLTKGWGRLTAIDDAQFKLQGLGHTAQGVSQIMDSSLTAVKGTAYGLGDAASAAASAVASGIEPGEELTGVLTTMADTAAISGASLQDMALIFNSVAARGKLQGDDLLQLLGRGVPVLQLLSEQLGVTSADVSAMVSDGKIDFATFEAAMRDGMGGAAKEMGNSIRGSLANVGAAVGRLGEAILKPVMQHGPQVIAGLTEGIDTLTDGVTAAVGVWEKLPEPIKMTVSAMVAAKVASMALGTTMGQAVTSSFASGVTSIKGFGSTMKEAVGYAKAANPQLGTLGASMTVLAGQGGVAATAMGKLKGAAGGLVNALGGPWTLGIAAAGIAIGQMVDAHQRASEAADTYREKMSGAAEQNRDFSRAVAEANGTLTDQAKELAAGIVDTQTAGLKALHDHMDGWAYTIPAPDSTEFTREIRRVAEANVEAQAGLAKGAAVIDNEYHHLTEAVKSAYADMDDYLASTGRSMDDLNSIIAAGGAEYQQLLDHLRGAGEGGELIARQFEQARSKMMELQQAASQVDDGFLDISAGMDQLADSSGGAASQIDGLRKSMEAAGLIQSSATEAAFEYADAIREIGEEVAGAFTEDGDLGQALFGEDGQLDVHSENAAALNEQMVALRDAFDSAVSSGMDASEAWDEAMPTMQALADATGLSVEQVQELARSYGMLPEEYELYMNIAGAGEVMGELGSIHMQLRELDEGETIKLGMVSDEAREALEEVGIQLHEYADGHYEATVDADTGAALSELETIMEWGGQLNELGIEPSILLSDEGFRGDAAAAQRILDQLDLAEASPEAKLIATQLKNGVNVSMGDLARLTAETARPDADLERWAFDSGYQIVDGKLQALDASSATPEVRAQDNASSTLDNIRSKLFEIPLVRTVTVNVIETAMKAKKWMGRADGGRIPRLASGGEAGGGYRLPTTGPGTDRVDGILGIDQDGLPVSWVNRGEYVVNAAATDRYLPLIEAINRRDEAAINLLAGRRVPQLAAGGHTTGATTMRPVEPQAPAGVEQGTAPVVADTEMADAELARLQENIHALTDQPAVVTVDTTLADEGLAATAGALNNLPNAAPEVIVDGAPALEATEEVNDALTGLQDDDHTIPVNVDTEGLEDAAGEAREALTGLTEEGVTASADLDAAPLEASADEATGTLDTLGEQRPVPTSDLDYSDLQAGADHSMGELQALGGAKSTSVADVDNSSALTNINATISELNRMPVERVIKIVAHGTAGLAKGGEVPGLATGGTIAGGTLPTTGPGTGQTDGFLGVDAAGMPLVRVDAGEYVVTASSVPKYRRELDMINRGVFPKLDNLDMLERGAQRAPGLARGGMVSPDQLLAFARGQSVMGQQAARSLEGAPYVWGGVNWGDCSGAMSGLARFATGQSAFAGRFATGNQREALSAMGFRPGLGPSATSFNLGWFNGGPWGGHTAGTIAGTNVEMGGGRGNGQIGGPAAGAADGQFTDHAWIPLGELVAFDYYRPLAPVMSRRVPAPMGGLSLAGGLGVGAGGHGVGAGGRGVTLHDRGGWHQPGTLAYNGLSEPEPILTPDQWRTASGAMAASVELAKMFPQFSDQILRAGRTIEEAAGNLLRASDTPVETARAWRGLLDGNLDYSTVAAIGRGQPVVGTGLTARTIIGDGASRQLIGLSGGHAREVKGALEQELFINIAMSDQTIEAYEELEKAREEDKAAAEELKEAEEAVKNAREAAASASTDQADEVARAEADLADARREAASSDDPEKAAEKVKDAEDKLADARDKGSSKAEDAAQDIADAEEKLKEARANKMIAATRVIEAQTGLQVAAVLGAIELVDKVLTRVTDTITGGFQAAADSVGILGDALAKLGENLDMVAEAADSQADAQDKTYRAQQALAEAENKVREAQRDAAQQRRADLRDMQQAEWDLAMTRHDAVQVSGAAEIDLSEVRTRGIFNVMQMSDAGTRAAIRSASDVAVAEAGLANARAQMNENDFNMAISVADANDELAYAQDMAQFQMERLTSATKALAKAQALAAGEIGGATALERFIEGAKELAEADAMTAEAVGKGTNIGNLLPWNWGNFGEAAELGKQAEAKRRQGQNTMDAYRDLALKELDNLDPEVRAEVEKAIRELVTQRSGGAIAGDTVVGIIDAISGSGGALLGAKRRNEALDITATLDNLLDASNKRIEAAQLEAEKEKADIDRRQQRRELEFARVTLEKELDRSEERNYLADISALLEDQLAEHEQENRQLGGLNDKLDKDNKSVLMSIGGSGWGADSILGDLIGANEGGFGGVTDHEVGDWASLNVEQGWLNSAVARPLVDGVRDTVADALAAENGLIEGLPDTVVDGYYERALGAVVPGAVDAARRSAAVVGQQAAEVAAREATLRLATANTTPAPTTTVGTQFTGAVTVNGARADRLVDDLRRELIK